MLDASLPSSPSLKPLPKLWFYSLFLIQRAFLSLGWLVVYGLNFPPEILLDPTQPIH